MLRFMKIATVVTAMTFVGIAPVFADTPAGPGSSNVVNTVTQADTASTNSFDVSEFQPDPNSVEAYFTMPDGTVELGVHNADGSWSAPTDAAAAQ